MIKQLYYWLHNKTSRPQERGEYSAGYWQHKIRAQALALCPEISGRILEIGCGEGLFLEQLARQSANLALWGVDNNAQRIEQATARLVGKNVNLSLDDATRLKFDDGYFDSVLCINVFFNMPSIESVRKTLEQMTRVTKQAGVIIFDFRNAANPLLAIKYSLAPWYDKTVRDLPLKTYCLQQFEDMLKELRLGITEKIFIGSSWKTIAPIIMIKAKKL